MRNSTRLVFVLVAVNFVGFLEGGFVALNIIPAFPAALITGLALGVVAIVLDNKRWRA